MIEAETFPDRGLVRLSGPMPNGPAVFTRSVEGMDTYTLRSGIVTISTGGAFLEDSEAPLGVPLTYRGQVSTVDRLAQTNYVPTPTFLHGRGGWQAGIGRVMSTVVDPLSHSGTVAFVSDYASGTTQVTPPLYIGSVSTPSPQATGYTLTPPTSGGTAIATGDWMLLAHTQLQVATAPTMTGWIQVFDQTDQAIRLTVWARKRLVTDVGYAVTVGAGAQSAGTLLWVRGAIDEYWASTPTVTGGIGGNTFTVGPASTAQPSLAVSIFTTQLDIAAPPPGAGDVSGAIWRSSATPLSTLVDNRNLVVATRSDTSGGYGQQGTVTFPLFASLVGGVGLQIAFQSNNQVAERVIAREPIGALPASNLPYLLTGRFRYATVGLDTWQDVKNTYATWQAVKTANSTWLAVRGAAAAINESFLQLFITINNPSTGANLVAPQLVLSSTPANLGAWADFSVLFTAPAGIPAGSEIRLMHGVTADEYHVQWYLDEFGITSGEDRTHLTIPWFSGDSPLPPDPEDYIRGGGWTDLSGDSSIQWSGVAGNSTSIFLAPGTVAATIVTQLGQPEFFPSEPILLSDPVESALAVWVGLLPHANLTYPSRSSLYAILNRADSLSTNDIRGLPHGTLNFLTRTSSERAQVLSVFASGRTLLLRTTYREYPENDWYLSCGDLIESRPLPNQRESVRTWSVEYTHILRPAGLISVSSSATWQDVLNLGTWEDVKDDRTDWLDVLTTLPALR